MKLSKENLFSIFLNTVCIGTLLLALGAVITLHSLQSKQSWVTAPAKVTYAGRDEDGDYVVRYDYRVDGRACKGSCVDHGLLTGVFLDLNSRRAAKMYPTGSDITIYYNPDWPSHAVIWNGIPSEGPVASILGCILIMVAVVSLRKLKRMDSKRRVIDQIPASEKEHRVNAIKDWLDRRGPQAS